MPQIFVCYSRQNKEIVEILANDIEELGYSVWFDSELTGGQKWWDQILERILKCDIFVFALSPEAQNSLACKLELKYASNLCKRILPILVADGVDINLLSSDLSVIQYVGYQQQDKQAYKSLSKAFNTLPVPKPLPDSPPKPPEVPISYLGKLKEQIETPETLGFNEQSALVVQLEGKMREADNKKDVINLLHLLKARDDLLANIYRKIEDLLIGQSDSIPKKFTPIRGGQKDHKGRRETEQQVPEKPQPLVDIDKGDRGTPESDTKESHDDIKHWMKQKKKPLIILGIILGLSIIFAIVARLSVFGTYGEWW